MRENNEILNDIAQSIRAKGGKVEVYRIGRGVLGTFQMIEQARAYERVVVEDGQYRAIEKNVSNFWSVYYERGPDHERGTEIIIKSVYDTLEVRKIEPGLFHIVIPK